ncbi:MAG: preprotein translocase subunit YajC [Alphaproteobacteria bacterium]|nr:preprotein translocase subunit YajC [Alphaproteobacteria bacterium]
MEVIDKVTDAAAAPQGDVMNMLLFCAAMFGVIYFMMILPNKRKMKEYRDMLSKLTVGSKILMAGGIYGVVKKIDDKDLEVEIAKGVVVKIPRSAVANIE